jgi:hypothetical protein
MIEIHNNHWIKWLIFLILFLHFHVLFIYKLYKKGKKEKKKNAFFYTRGRVLEVAILDTYIKLIITTIAYLNYTFYQSILISFYAINSVGFCNWAPYNNVPWYYPISVRYVANGNQKVVLPTKSMTA